MIQNFLKIVPQIIIRVVGPPNVKILSVSSLWETVFLRVDFAQVSTVPRFFLHHQYIFLQIDFVSFGHLSQSHKFCSIALRCLQRNNVVSIVSTFDKSFYDASGPDSDLTGNFFCYISALFVNRKLEQVVGISLLSSVLYCFGVVSVSKIKTASYVYMIASTMLYVGKKRKSASAASSRSNSFE